MPFILTTLRLCTIVLALLSASTRAHAQDAPATGRKFALTVERFAGFGFSYGRVDAANGEGVDLNAFVLGGTQANPLGAPRVGFELITPGNLVVGGTLGFTTQTLTFRLGSSSSDASTLSLWTLLFGGRVGYRAELGDSVDIIPRAGLTMLTGTLTFPGNRSCDSMFSPQTGIPTAEICTTQSGPSGSLFAGMFTLDVVGRIRLTPGFFLDGAIAYDQPLFANLSFDQFSSQPDTSGTYLHLQLWFGLGGYL